MGFVTVSKEDDSDEEMKKKIKKVIRLMRAALERMRIELTRGRGTLSQHNQKKLQNGMKYAILAIKEYRSVL